MNPWIALAFVLALGASWVGGQYRGAANERTAWMAKTEKQRADAETKARETEQLWQGVVNETSKRYLSEVADRDRKLGIALDSLRDRPSRPSGVSETPSPGCAGANGAELSRADAEFLVREAARADGIRAGLAACYEVIDKAR